MATLDALVEVLTKTPVRDTANNPVMQPVPIRPHLPIPHTIATLADFLAYKNQDTNDQLAWELLNPNDKPMNHRPTDAAIKSSVMLALGSSIFPPYSILAQRYRQNDHANKTWTDLRMDIDSIITNNITGTSRDSDINMRQRERTFREWRNSPSRFDQPPTESRSSRTLYDNYHSDGRKRANDQPYNQPHLPQDVWRLLLLEIAPKLFPWK